MKPPQLFVYNSQRLEYEQLSLKPLLILPIALVLAVLCSYLFFRAELIESWEWKLAGKELRKETVKITVSDWLFEN